MSTERVPTNYLVDHVLTGSGFKTARVVYVRCHLIEGSCVLELKKNLLISMMLFYSDCKLFILVC
jgi:hypothetical protein